MKLVPGYTFKVTQRPRDDFKLGESYRIYHIAPLEEGVEYIFQSKGGNLKVQFDSTEYAEAIIGKMTGTKV
jgi:hypothetical protein